MHTTTVRFDADVWALVAAHCRRLGISYGEFIRGAVLLRLGSLLVALARVEGVDVLVSLDRDLLDAELEDLMVKTPLRS